MMITCPCNIDPITPPLLYSKIGVYRGIHYFLFLHQNIKGKGDALNRGNYRGLKLIEQVMKVLECVVEGLIRQRVEIDKMQCGFMSGRGTTDAIFIERQLQEKH